MQRSLMNLTVGGGGLDTKEGKGVQNLSSLFCAVDPRPSDFFYISIIAIRELLINFLIR
jgi:hypothetical protein